MGSLGVSEMLMIFVIALLVFGPKKLPELGKSLGKGIREFKKATEDLKSNWDEHVKDIAEPLNDARREIHGMGENIKARVYEHLEPPTETAPKELPAPAATQTEEHREASNHTTESNSPKEHV
jgi:TatA/E family protein of Tat protein translocase